MRKQARKLFHGVTDFFSEMNRMNKAMYRRMEHTERTEETAWAPLTDIRADGNELVIRCELPGVEMSDIDISFAGGVLSITGTRQTADDQYYVQERFFGAFRRVIGLPEGVGDNDIQANLRHGVLVIRVSGGATTAKPKRIRLTDSND
ncbi:MAG TPA: Hsp20/alpha crystallin family protein [Oleiagrimonas sp.]|nr:Hsp20/alpha crystallin family protein [Oleiagrimonas sp.]